MPDNTPLTALTGLRVHDAVEGRALARPRQQTSVAAVARVTEILFHRVDPTSPTSSQRLRGQEVQRYYSYALLKPKHDEPSLLNRIAGAMVAGDRLYLHGEVLGVGASTLVTDYVRSFNQTCRDARDPRRAVYVRIAPGANNPRHFLDSMALNLGAPLSATELTRRSPEFLALRLLATVRMRGVTGIVVDEVGNAGPNLQAFLAELVRVMDPTYHAALEGYDEPMARVGMVLVGHRPPERLFRRSPDALLALEGNVALLGRYTTVEQMWEALRMAGIGLDDCGAEPGDEALAAAILDYTHGLPAHMTPLFQHIDTVARHCGRRPDLAVLTAAQKVHRPMVRTAVVQLSPDSERVATEAVGVTSASSAGDAEGTSVARPSDSASDAMGQRRSGGARGPGKKVTVPRAPKGERRRTRQEEIAQRNYDRSVSEAERRDLTRSSRVIL